MKTIIVPTDFSAISNNAAYYAADLALTVNAAIYLLNVVTLPVTFSEVPPPTDIMIDEANTSMQRLKEELEEYTEGKLEIKTKVTMGLLLTELNSLTDSKDILTIVMGMEGAGAADRFLFGSNALDVMKKIAFPAIIVPQHAHFDRICKIGLACDMHNGDASLPVKEIEEIVKLFNAQLEILFIYKYDSKLSPDILPGSITLQNDFSKLHPKFHYILNDNIENGIIDTVEEQEIDLLIIMPKKHDFLAGLFHKSVSKAVALNINRPIMTMH